METKGLKDICKADPIFAKAIEFVVLKERRPARSYFDYLARAIVGQQLSVKAANTIYGRFTKLLNKNVTAKNILLLSDSEMRQVGLSYQKISYLKNLSTAVESKSLNFKKVSTLSDQEAIDQLVQVKGVGTWTAEMFLIFALNKPDVFSYKDLGLRNAIKKIYRLKKDPSEKMLSKISARWVPYRSTAALYLWASLDNQ